MNLHKTYICCEAVIKVSTQTQWPVTNGLVNWFSLFSSNWVEFTYAKLLLRDLFSCLSKTRVTLGGCLEGQPEWTLRSWRQSVVSFLTRSCLTYVNSTLCAHGQFCTRNLLLARHAATTWRKVDRLTGKERPSKWRALNSQLKIVLGKILC